MENDEITQDDVEKLLKKKVYWKIPNNYFAHMAAINKGVLLSELNPDSNVAQSYKELAMHVSDSVFSTALINKFVPDSEKRLSNILEM
jgi:Flp pilus assembly CpaE family ATPase